MAQAATFNDELYRALRDSGMEEQHAMRAAMPERENIPARSEVAVLQTKVTTVEAVIIGMDKRLDHLEKQADVTDEKISSPRTLLFAIYTPLLLLILASQFGILTRSIR